MLPQLIAKTDNITMINQFLGINKTGTVADNEFCEMKNITNDFFPVLGTRKRRGLFPALKNVKAVCSGENISYVAQDPEDDKYYLYYGESQIADAVCSGDDSTQIVRMGAYICVFPDGIVYNTNTLKVENINITCDVNYPSFTLCKFDGSEYDSSKIHTGSSAPSDTTAYPYWIDTSNKSAVLKMYSTNLSMWTSVGTTYVKIIGTGLSKFKANDAVTISNLELVDSSGNAWTYNEYDFNKSNLVYAAGRDSLNREYIVITGFINKVYKSNSKVKFERLMPRLNFVCEMDNRLWGCSSLDHEIYACKQGDPLNWYAYFGYDSDSYAATVGSQDDFTGCASFGGNIFFFKEHGFHKVYGSKPSNYEIVWKETRGVQRGSEKSIACVGDYLFYKAKDGVVMFDGGANVISDKLGFNDYYGAVGCGYRDKYYISMRDNQYNYSLYIYDISKGIWIAEDEIRVGFMAETTKNGLYIIKYKDAWGMSDAFIVNDEKMFTTIFPMRSDLGDAYLYPNEEFYPMYVQTDASLENTANIKWSFTTGDIGMDSPFYKYIKRIILRLSLDLNTTIKVDVMYDSCGEWQRLMEYHCTKKRSYEIPMVVRRCDHLKLRFYGNGDFRLYSIAKVIEEGSGNNG